MNNIRILGGCVSREFIGSHLRQPSQRPRADIRKRPTANPLAQAAAWEADWLRLQAEHRTRYVRPVDPPSPAKRRRDLLPIEMRKRIRRAKGRLSLDWATACHEASHAVAAAIGGVRFSVASIIESEHTLGHVKLFTSEAKPEALLSVACCGEAAAAKLAGDGDYRLNPRDLRIAIGALAKLHKGNRQRVHEGLATAKREATRFVAEHWPTIEKVARELLANRWLGEPEIKRLIREG